MSLTGAVHKYGDHVNTDVILPGRYLALRSPEDLGRHCLEGLDPGFIERVQPGDILVGGRNFGAGSSREHAPIAIKAAGIACVVAESFARIFFRNAINIGLPVLICPEFAAAAGAGQIASVDLDEGILSLGARRFKANPLPPAVAAIIRVGGLVPFVRARLASS